MRAFQDFERKLSLIELMKDNAICRTAPAKPSLLNIEYTYRQPDFTVKLDFSLHCIHCGD